MRLQRSILVFLIVLGVAATSHAYVGLKLGAYNTQGTTNFGGGVIFGLPLPLTGLTAEAEVTGYYNNQNFIDIFYIQPSVGASYDFNSLITPDSNLVHPYLRAGFAYGFITFTGNTILDNQSAPGFYTGAGVSFKLPIVTLGVESNYNYINFSGTTSQDFWNFFTYVGIGF